MNNSDSIYNTGPPQNPDDSDNVTLIAENDFREIGIPCMDDSKITTLTQNSI